MVEQDEELLELLREEGITPDTVWVKRAPVITIPTKFEVDSGDVFVNLRKGRRLLRRKETVEYVKKHYPELFLW